MFTDRQEAGEKLASTLESYRGSNSVIFAIPRGGVVVAHQVASSLKLDFSLIIPRKIGAPGNPELAIGATAGKGQVVLNKAVIQALNVSDEYIKQAASRENEEIKRREERYLRGKEQPDITGKSVIIIDDGLATGSTAEVAIKALKARRPSKVILAVPVAPPETVEKMKNIADEVVVLEAPSTFYAVGQFYDYFPQTTDEEVVEIMEKH